LESQLSLARLGQGLPRFARNDISAFFGLFPNLSIFFRRRRRFCSLLLSRLSALFRAGRPGDCLGAYRRCGLRFRAFNDSESGMERSLGFPFASGRSGLNASKRFREVGLRRGLRHRGWTLDGSLQGAARRGYSGSGRNRGSPFSGNERRGCSGSPDHRPLLSRRGGSRSHRRTPDLGLRAGRRARLGHDHDFRYLPLVIKQETVIQGGEDSLDSLLQGQVCKGHRDPFLEQRFISFKGNARLSFDIPGYTYQRGILEVYGHASALNTHALRP